MKELFHTAVLMLGLMAPAVMADEVVLQSGDRFSGQIVERSDRQVVLMHPVLGRLVIPAAQIKAMTAPPPAEAAAPVPPPAPLPPPAQPGFFDGWKSQFEVGLGGATGNTEYLNVRVGFQSEREDKTSKWKFDTGYNRNATDGNTTRNDFTAGLRHDWLLPDQPWFFFAQGRYDYDDYKSWLHRLSGGGGVGYHLIKSEQLTLDLRGGIGLSKEWGSPNDGVVPEGLLGADLSWKPWTGHAVTAQTTLYPSFDELGEFRAVSGVAWVIDFAAPQNLALKLGVEHEYESQVAPGRKHNDLRYIASLLFKF